ncbi:hypothetical protein HHK36_020813 [Tetracentron sinense]|uniref:Condensin-2 complex subunit H2 n=1 Tax=Tetracentron sinense TaxID=13715 RepID=A0A834YS92_TETSI|nr:hypothetical protein HHK36_020813 [Tetracentron sinense]
MNNDREKQSGEGCSTGFHIVQPHRDLESNWAVDLAKNLEEYLLKICSGEITGDEDGHLSVNFAEAALLLQGSIQVYSRKVEYLYSLVVHALEFISQKRPQDRAESTSVQPEGIDSHAVADEENELFLGLDDVPVEDWNCINDVVGKDDTFNHFVKPPANLVVLEGDCLDTTGAAGELESYLLATNDLYQDFILLDPCDAVAIHDFLNGDKVGKGNKFSHRGSSLNSKARKSFQSPTRRSGGTAHTSSLKKSQDVNLNGTPAINSNFEVIDNNICPNDVCNIPENNYHGYEADCGYSEPGDDSDDDDPWKPLNPHEPGNLKVKPFKKVKVLRRQGISSAKRIHISTQFPLAKLHGTISPEFTETWELNLHVIERSREFQSPPLYEKLRQSLAPEGHETYNPYSSPEFANEDNDYDTNIHDVDDVPDYMDAEVPLYQKEHGDDAFHLDNNEAFEQEDPNSHASLEDLCRSHLDSLLASIAETEKQTELAARVSTWKQRIEHNLEEQDLRTPFDIHEYSGRVLDKLSLQADCEGAMSFADVVRGQEKHDVARTFSALLQLVNNGNVDLDRGELGGESVCYTAVNPFHVRLLMHDPRRKEVQLRSSKKRGNSPTRKGCTKGDEKLPQVRSSSLGFSSTVKSSQPSGKFSVKLGKVGGVVRCTPEAKRRRSSRPIETAELQFAG